METELTLTIAGMSCGHCVQHVTKALQAIGGVQVRSVQLGSAQLSFDPAKSTEQAIISALNTAGYPASK
jgi:copper chaperone CopZ